MASHQRGRIGISNGQPRSIGAQALKILHLPVFAAGNDTLHPQRRQGMNGERRKTNLIAPRRAQRQMRLPPHAQRGDQTHPGDANPLHAKSPNSVPRPRTISARLSLGKGKMRRVYSASAAIWPSLSMRPFITA